MCVIICDRNIITSYCKAAYPHHFYIILPPFVLTTDLSGNEKLGHATEYDLIKKEERRIISLITFSAGTYA